MGGNLKWDFSWFSCSSTEYRFNFFSERISIYLMDDLSD